MRLAFTLQLILFSIISVSAAAQENKLAADSGYCAYDAISGEPIVEVNADRQLAPASVLKLLVTAVSLEKLGPEFSFDTSVFAEGFHGDAVSRLIIRGRGDPSMTTERLWLLARQIKLFGIKHIGTLVLDESAFQGAKPRTGERAFLAAISPFNLNFGAVGAVACAGDGVTPSVSADVWEGPFAVISPRVRVQAGDSGSITVDSRDISDSRQELTVTGAVGKRSTYCETEYRSAANPVGMFSALLQSYLKALSIKVEGVQRVSNAGPENREPLFLFPSLPLRQILTDMNHFSNNISAELILMALGSDGAARPTYDRARGLATLVSTLREWGITGFDVIDAAGLERANKLAPRSLCKLLLQETRQFPQGYDFFASLPVFAQSGTVRTRSNAILARAKTGSLSDVSSVAGLMKSPGREIVFAIIQNRVGDLAAAKVAEDRLLTSLSNRVLKP